MLFRAASRYACSLRPMVAIAARAQVPRARAFTVTPFARMSQGVVDRDLEQKLVEELKYEKEQVHGEEVPSFLKEFQNKGIWKVEDKRGEKEISMSRTFGNEKITLLFSTDALVEAQEFDEGASEEEERSLPVNLSVIVQKQSGSTDHGALDISATAQDGSFFIESVAYSPSSFLVVDQTAEGDWQRRGRFGGPVFADLDDSLQELFHSYLEERGLDDNLAAFIPQYVEHKEQKEYASWLDNVAKFVKQ
ncbi:hypothetical protein SpCBS45565_g00039 [Spizellomyces sp. 'palustris']|nr:hypothetical protein SpCBS45565_g00039 [Spizellomyces sp. 'palustris']